MGQKIQKIVQGREKIFDLLLEKIKATKPKKTIGKIGKGAGVALTHLFDGLTWLAEAALLDNPMIRKLEKEFKSIKNINNEKGQEVAIKKILKKYPTAMALLIDWIVATGMMIGATKLVPSKIQDKKEDKKEAVNPSDSDYINKAIDAYFPSIFIGLTELETYRKTPTLQRGEKRYTYYLGLTWVYERDASGHIIQHPCDATWSKKAAKFTEQENQEQVKMHLEYETLKVLKNAVKNTDVAKDYNTTIGLLLAGYQRSGDVPGIVNSLAKAQTLQQKADAFMYYKGPERYKNGTLKRRWICAAYAVGVINDNDLLNMHRDAFTRLDINTYCRTGKDGKSHFMLDAETVSKILGIKNKNELVKDFVGKDIKPVDKEKNVILESENTYFAKSMEKLNQADKEYNNGNYKKAIDIYKKAIEFDADNMEAYSSLALAYIKLGDQKHSIDDYENACSVVREVNARMNQNKSLLHDPDVKAASYFNAGTARANMAELYKAQGNAQKAIEQYDKAISNYKTAISNNQQGQNSQTRNKLYNDAIQKAQKAKESISSKKLGFNKGAKTIESSANTYYIAFAENKGKMA